MARARTSRTSRHADNGRKKTRARRPHSHELVQSKRGTRYRRAKAGERSTNGWVAVPEHHTCGCRAGKKRAKR